jgi:dTDP-4-dehydrorhamnose reductase
MKRILITGAAGQLGLSLRDIHKDYREMEFVFMDSLKLDITEMTTVNSVFNASHYDYCINCAAFTNVDQAERTPELAFNVNSEGVKNLAEASKIHNTILIHISTDYVFDGEKNTPYSRNDNPNPINVYGKSKMMGESYIKENLSDYFIIRSSWLYNKDYGKNFYKSILEKAKMGKIIGVTNEQTGCPTNTLNLSKFILDLIAHENYNYGIYHFTDGEIMTWYDFAKRIVQENELNGISTIVKNNSYPSLALRPKYSVLRNSNPNF